MKVRIFLGERAIPKAEVRRTNEEAVPAVGDFIEFVTDHDERRWVARITKRLFYYIPGETLVEIFAQEVQCEPS